MSVVALCRTNIYIHVRTLLLHMKNLYNTPFSYMLCLFCKKAYRELNLVRALGEDTGPGDFSFPSSSSPLGQTAV